MSYSALPAHDNDEYETDTDRGEGGILFSAVRDVQSRHADEATHHYRRVVRFGLMVGLVAGALAAITAARNGAAEAEAAAAATRAANNGPYDASDLERMQLHVAASNAVMFAAFVDGAAAAGATTTGDEGIDTADGAAAPTPDALAAPRAGATRSSSPTMAVTSEWLRAPILMCHIISTDATRSSPLTGETGGGASMTGAVSKHRIVTPTSADLQAVQQSDRQANQMALRDYHRHRAAQAPPAGGAGVVAADASEAAQAASEEEVEGRAQPLNATESSAAAPAAASAPAAAANATR